MMVADGDMIVGCANMMAHDVRMMVVDGDMMVACSDMIVGCANMMAHYVCMMVVDDDMIVGCANMMAQQVAHDGMLTHA